MQGNHDAGPSRLGGVYSMFGAAASSQLSETTSYPTDPSTSTSGFDWELEDSSRALDLVFIMDATGSMGSYIASATKNIEAICDNIIQSERLRGPGALRVGLIAYRDHPPQDHTYVTKTVPLNSDIQVTKDFLKKLYASGGGDGPEAVTAAMAEVLRMDWRPNATKMTVLIADAPPHGIGEYGDGFPNGSPDGNDPLVIAKAMAAAGIPLFMVACEPALSGYANAADFFQGLVKITGALLVPLTTASLLSHVIIAAAGEAMDLERLHREVGDAVADRLRSLSLDGSSNSELDMDQVARQLHQTLLGRNENTKQLHVENIYRESEESKHNIEVWSQAPDVEHAKPFIKKVIGSRLSDKYLSTRSTSSSYKPFTPYPHPRGGTSTSSDLYGSTTTTTIIPSTSTSNSSGSSGTSPNPSPSGSRRVISDFSAFSASPGLSISPSSRNNPNPNSTSNSFSSSTPSKLSASFRERSAMRGMEDDDEEDEDMGGGGGGISKDDWLNDGDGKPLPAANMNADGELVVAGDDGQQLNYKQGVISLDQARRLAQLSASRRT